MSKERGVVCSLWRSPLQISFIALLPGIFFLCEFLTFLIHEEIFS